MNLNSLDTCFFLPESRVTWKESPDKMSESDRFCKCRWGACAGPCPLLPLPFQIPRGRGASPLSMRRVVGGEVGKEIPNSRTFSGRPVLERRTWESWDLDGNTFYEVQAMYLQGCLFPILKTAGPNHSPGWIVSDILCLCLCHWRGCWKYAVMVTGLALNSWWWTSDESFRLSPVILGFPSHSSTFLCTCWSLCLRGAFPERSSKVLNVLFLVKPSLTILSRFSASLLWCFFTFFALFTFFPSLILIPI